MKKAATAAESVAAASASHTPGPWKCGGDEPFVYALNAHGSNRFFAAVNAGWTSGEAIEGRTEHAELLANARLIAAAPDLLAALEELDERLRKCMRDPITAAEAYDSFYQGIVEDAINKAKGIS